jgi:hypothetical protein
MSKNIHPKWWQLYLTLPLLIVLFLVDHRLGLSMHGHQIVQIGIVLFVYTLVHLWLNANEADLSKLDQRKFRGTVTVIRVPPYQLPTAEYGEGPMLQLPDPGLKGLLSNTFEMDTIDMELFPVDEVQQEMNKE